MNTKALLHLLAILLNFGGILFGMDLSSDTEEESMQWDGTVGSFLTSQLSGARELVSYGRHATGDLILQIGPALKENQDKATQQNDAQQKIITLFINDDAAYSEHTSCLTRDVKRVLTRTLLHEHPIIQTLNEKVKNLCCVETSESHASTVGLAEFNGAGDTIITASADGILKTWDASSGRCFRTQHGKRVMAVHINGLVGRFITAYYNAGPLMIWDATSGARIHTLQVHDGKIVSARFNKAGDKVVTASNDGTAMILDVESGNFLQLLIHTGKVYSAEFNKAGDQIVTFSVDAHIKIWDADSGECLRTLQAGGVVYSAFFNEEGDEVITTCSDKTTKIWNVQSGQCIREMQNRSRDFRFAQFNRSGDRILVIETDGPAKILSLTTLNCLYTFPRYKNATFFSARFNAAGDKVVTACGKKVKIWDIAKPDAAMQWLENQCTLEQALLLHCIYKARIIGLALNKKEGKKWLGGLVYTACLDFNAFPHLQQYFETMPVLIQTALLPFVKLKMMSDTSI